MDPNSLLRQRDFQASRSFIFIYAFPPPSSYSHHLAHYYIFAKYLIFQVLFFELNYSFIKQSKIENTLPSIHHYMLLTLPLLYAQAPTIA